MLIHNNHFKLHAKWLSVLQLERVEKVRQTNDTQLQDIRLQIDEKLKSADEKRDEIIKQLQEKLRLHVNAFESDLFKNFYLSLMCLGGAH